MISYIKKLFLSFALLAVSVLSCRAVERPQNLVVRWMDKNPCWTNERRIIEETEERKKGIMAHSTASPGVMAKDWYALWNKSLLEGGREVAVHAFVDDKEILELLPWCLRAWHCGRAYRGGPSGNDTHISIEMCEPASIKYDPTHSKIIEYDPAAPENIKYFAAALQNMVNLCAYLCDQFEIEVDNIVCHAEAHGKGFASNHADVEHWWPLHGVSMDTFRTMVKDTVEDRPVRYDFDARGQFIKYRD